MRSLRFLALALSLAAMSACAPPDPYAGAPVTSEPIIMPAPVFEDAVIEREPSICETAIGGEDDGIGGTGCSVD